MKSNPTYSRFIPALLAAITSIAIFQSGALAGGPARLRLPVDGITPQNEKACAKLMREILTELASRPVDPVSVKDGYVTMTVTTVPISLTELGDSLKGSAFSIPIDQLYFDGALRIEIDKTKDLKKITADLRTDPYTTVSTMKSGNGPISILVKNRNELPLVSYSDIEWIVKAHGGELLDIKWGGKFTHWTCGPPLGALRLADATTIKAAASKNAKSSATKSVTTSETSENKTTGS